MITYNCDVCGKTLGGKPIGQAYMKGKSGRRFAIYMEWDNGKILCQDCVKKELNEIKFDFNGLVW